MKSKLQLSFVFGFSLFLVLTSSAWPQQNVRKKGIDGVEEQSPFDKPSINRALIIGINEYLDGNFRELKNAAPGAKEVEDVLINKYNYHKEHIAALYNSEAQKNTIVFAIKNMIKKSNFNDSLFIYFAGHGYYDGTLDLGYWLPYDAAEKFKDGEKTVDNEVSGEVILQLLMQCKAKNIFLVSDSCYSTRLFRNKLSDESSHMKFCPGKKSRQVLLSGAEQVSDGLSGNGSPFTKCFLECLNENWNAQLQASKVISHVKTKAIRNFDREAGGGRLIDKNAADENGDFVFHLKLNREEAKLKKAVVGFLKDYKDSKSNRLKLIKNLNGLLDKYDYIQKTKYLELLRKKIELFGRLAKEYTELEEIFHLPRPSQNKNNIDGFIDFIDKWQVPPLDEGTGLLNEMKKTITGFIEKNITADFEALQNIITNKTVRWKEKKKKCRHFLKVYKRVFVKELHKAKQENIKRFLNENNPRRPYFSAYFSSVSFFNRLVYGESREFFLNYEIGYAFGKKVRVTPCVSFSSTFLDTFYSDLIEMPGENSAIAEMKGFKMWNFGLKVGTHKGYLTYINFNISYSPFFFSVENFIGLHENDYLNFQSLGNKKVFDLFSIGSDFGYKIFTPVSLCVGIDYYFLHKEKVTYPVITGKGDSVDLSFNFLPKTSWKFFAGFRIHL